jgi:transposase
MLTVEAKEAIRRAHFLEGKSIRQIQQEQGYHRKTIRKALQDGEAPRYRQEKGRGSPVLGPVQGIIGQWLAEDEQRPAKQRHTAKRIYERLCAEYGFAGAESTVRYYVSQQRKRPGSAVFIPLAYAPGEIGQVDFGAAQVKLAGVLVTVQLFCLRLGYSKQPFVLALPSQAQEAFLEGHVQAFAFLGGAPKVLVYDNLKAAVKRILEGRNREEQAAFIGLRSHYLFASRFCTPAQGHEKGLVEGLVGYARRNWLVPPPAFANWQELNAYLAAKCRAEGERRLRGMCATVGEMLAVEQEQLLPLPAHPYPCCAMQPVAANGFGLVTYQTNRYSVPAEHAHERLWLRAFVHRIEISNGRQLLAVHERSYRREQDILQPLHYLALLEQRPGAWEQARPIREWQQQWPPVFHRYLEALREHLPADQGTREFVRILRLLGHHSEAVLAAALEQALAGHCHHADGVKQLVLRLTESAVHSPVAPLDAGQYAHLVVGPVTWPPLAQFDQLLKHPPAAQPAQTGGVT